MRYLFGESLYSLGKAILSRRPVPPSARIKRISRRLVDIALPLHKHHPYFCARIVSLESTFCLEHFDHRSMFKLYILYFAFTLLTLATSVPKIVPRDDLCAAGKGTPGSAWLCPRPDFLPDVGGRSCEHLAPDNCRSVRPGPSWKSVGPDFGGYCEVYAWWDCTGVLTVFNNTGYTT